MKMLYLVLFSFVLGTVSSAVAGEDYSMCYEVGRGEESCMSISVNSTSRTIYIHMGDHDDFEDVETLEDYSAGFAASRVESQEACYVRRLVTSLEQQVAYIQGHQQNAQTVDSDVRVMGVSLDDPEEEIGESLTHFCGDLPVYKLVKDESDDDGVDGATDKRSVSVSFRRCVLFCFIARCFTTTLTVPTGSSITFLWFFG
ncbi:hypothetical protein SK128_000483 [Halocaridina rubra]|uniref:BRICHOS domain-containing protein n=1 Tax=Halocaridina rubra TaxID=373956 RepID=A0AAN8XKL6_HALRR